MINDLGQVNSIDVINERIALRGQRVIDIGCGDMTFSRILVEQGAEVIAMDPDATQAAKNQIAPATPGLAFIQASAESLPVMSHTVDGAFFSFSLHHVPAAAYPAVFAEVERVLKPGGFLCVIEPIDCPLNQVMRFFHDEEAVRAAAQEALHELAIPMFEQFNEYRYHSFIQYDSFDAFAERYGNRTFNSGFTAADVRRPEVEEMFERHGAPDYRFQSPKQMMLLQGATGLAGSSRYTS